MAKILVVDDDERLCDMLCRRSRNMGHDASFVLTLAEGRDAVRNGQFDIIFLDVRLPDGNGLTALPEFRDADSKPEVFIITGEGNAEGAELAIRSGAWDYVCKPASMQDITLQVQRALSYRKEKTEKAPPVTLKTDGILGNSPSTQRAFDLLAQAAGSTMNVLLSGETGTGKELFARAIHENSTHVQGDLVVVDCAALPDTLVESVLFGHEKGAFTGADRAQFGLLKQANGGTLFLDEVGELPLSVQKAFLRVLQERRFRPVGGQEEVHSDFRLVAATNRNLDAMVAEGTFRSDLLFRLRTLAIDLPPLRERKGDAKYIAMQCLDRLCAERGMATRGFSPDFMEALEGYPWPGNVRELLSTVEHALASAGDDSTLFARHLSIHVRVALARLEADRATSSPETAPLSSQDGSLPEYRQFRAEAFETLEREYLQSLIVTSSGDYREACRISGLAKSRLYELLKKNGLSI
jgi:two-component system, NtrC family, response regulator